MKAVKVYNFCGENNVNFNELKYNLEVTLDDMLLSSPFVLAGKTEMNPKWLSEYYQGNKEFASKDVANHIKKEILEARDIYEHINNENAESRLKIELFKKKRFGNDIIMFLEKYVKDE